MESTKAISIKEKQPINNLTIPFKTEDPEETLKFAHRAATALLKVVSSKAKKVMINGEQYLTFSDLQIIGKFYGITTGVESCKQVMNENKAFGYEAKAVAFYNNGIISSAFGSTFRDEKNWQDKPSFMLKSMAQTRSMAKCLRNVLSWVIVLAGFKPTSAEDMQGINDKQINDYDFKAIELAPDPTVDMSQSNVDYAEHKAEYEEYINDQLDAGITDKQKQLLIKLITEKVADTEDVNQQILELESMTKQEASTVISDYIN